MGNITILLIIVVIVLFIIWVFYSGNPTREGYYGSFDPTWIDPSVDVYSRNISFRPYATDVYKVRDPALEDPATKIFTHLEDQDRGEFIRSNTYDTDPSHMQQATIPVVYDKMDAIRDVNENINEGMICIGDLCNNMNEKETEINRMERLNRMGCLSFDNDHTSMNMVVEEESGSEHFTHHSGDHKENPKPKNQEQYLNIPSYYYATSDPIIREAPMMDDPTFPYTNQPDEYERMSMSDEEYIRYLDKGKAPKIMVKDTSLCNIYNKEACEKALDYVDMNELSNRRRWPKNSDIPDKGFRDSMWKWAVKNDMTQYDYVV